MESNQNNRSIRQDYRRKQQEPMPKRRSDSSIRGSDGFSESEFLQLAALIPNHSRPTLTSALRSTTERRVYRNREGELPTNQQTNFSQKNKQMKSTIKSIQPSHSDSSSNQSYSQTTFDNHEQYQTDSDDPQMPEDFFEADLNIQQFILSNHLGILDYRLPKRNIRIHDRIYQASKYEYNMKELVKLEIIADVNRRIEEKQQEIFQRQIRVELRKQYLKNQKTQKSEQYIVMKAVKTKNNYENYYHLEQFLIKGQRLGILSKERRFNLENLKSNYHPTYLCFIWKDFKYQSHPILIKSQQQLEVLEPFERNYEDSKLSNKNQQKLKSNEYYYFDLESIISGKRQYLAAQFSSDLPLIDVICKNAGVRCQKNQLKKREKLMNSEVMMCIKSQRNKSQVKAIKAIALKDTGIYLIQGPPGTGKTQSITNYVSLEQYYFKYGQKKQKYREKDVQQKKKDKLMICAQSNAAINHIGRKMLTQKLIGRKQMPKILRLGHTEQFDQLLLSINLPHLCQIRLRNTQDKPNEWSAKIRWQKQVIQQKIQKMMSQTKRNQTEIQKQKENMFYKIKKLVQIHEDLRQKAQEYEKIQQQYLEQSEIVLSTLNTSGKIKFANFYKDRIRCLIIDEASQATQISALIPFNTNVLKVILVGDHMQLQPTVMSKNFSHTRYNRSLFQRLIDCGKVPYLLDTQYRMVPELQEFPSRYFYENRLKCGGNAQVPQSLKSLTQSSVFFNIPYGEEKKIKKSYHNPEEITCVKILVSKILGYDKQLSIGIIAPYKSQIKQLQDVIFKLGVSGVDKVKISTVDAFQGQQVDIIIISCVRANKSKEIGFVRDEKRMNVAITRAKYALFVFGNAETLRSNHIWSQYIDYHRQKRSLFHISNRQNQENEIRNHVKLNQSSNKKT